MSGDQDLYPGKNYNYIVQRLTQLQQNA